MSDAVIGDPFEHEDAVYVLGALADEDRAAFEEHLLTCSACTARVREVKDTPDLLMGISPDEVWAGEPMPDTLLPGLLHRAARHKRRQRGLVAALGSVAAACLVALAIVLWPTASAKHDGPAGRAFAAVTPSPVRATATLTAKAWGTAIDVRCHYLTGKVDRRFAYKLVVYGRDGSTEDVGSWQLTPDRDITFPAGTSLPASEIVKIEITLPNGKAILRLVA